MLVRHSLAQLSQGQFHKPIVCAHGLGLSTRTSPAVTLNGRVGGNVEVRGDGEVELDEAKVGGSVRYRD